MTIGMPAQPTVSTVIATRNRADLLPRALRSIYAQKGRGERFALEIIAVDDASEDHTREVVSRYPEVRLIHLTERRGIGGARNAGLAASTGAYIAFLDDDDEWTPTKIERQLGAMLAHPDVGVVYSQFLIHAGGKRMLYPTDAPSGDVFERLLFDNLCGIPAVPLIRRSALEHVGGFATDLWCEDYDLWLRLAARCRFLFVPGAVAVYRRSVGGAFMEAVRAGRYADDLRRIIEGALASAPERHVDAELHRAALATVELRVANGLMDLNDTHQALVHLRRGAEIYPPLLDLRENQRTVARIIGGHANRSQSPVAAARALWRELMMPGGRARQARPLATRRVLSDALWGIAVSRSRGIHCARNGRIAAQAALRSVLAYPLDLRPLDWARLAGYPVLERIGVRRRPALRREA